MAESQDDIWKQSERTHTVDPHGFWLARLMVESLFLMVDIQYPKPPAYPMISPLYPYIIPIVYLYIQYIPFIECYYHSHF